MAEFQNVMAQAKRMCETINNCGECPMGETCVFGVPSDPNYNYDIGKMEEVIMQWAEDNPEPQYPTWEEWQKENFPEAPFPISPCHFTRNKCHISDKHEASPCAVCRKQPIPADIAKRLGIKPKGEAK